MNCILIDDEPLARQELQDLIEEVSDLQIVSTFSNPCLAIDLLKENTVDLIFLDIEMPMINGLAFAAQVPKETLVIFTTAYSKYAVDSYELDALDYLLKPIDPERLKKAIAKAKAYKLLLAEGPQKNTLAQSTGDFILIKSDRRYYRINYADILYIEGLKDYSVIYLPSQRLITAMNLKTIYQKIPADTFVRVSKSYIINVNFIDSFDHNTIFLQGTEIPLGEVYKKDFFNLYFGGDLMV